MTESESIAFYRNMFRAYPPILDLEDNDVMKRCVTAYSALTGVTPTRDHIRLALAQHRKNRIKRSWDLKQKYMIFLFLQDIGMTQREVYHIINSLFNQRTRAGVIESCREAALGLIEEMSNEELNHWKKAVALEFANKAKEPSVL
jgi:hypothetical protein